MNKEATPESFLIFVQDSSASLDWRDAVHRYHVLAVHKYNCYSNANIQKK